MDNRAMNAWKQFEKTGSVSAYMQYRKLINNVETGTLEDFSPGGENGTYVDNNRWSGDQATGNR